MHVLEAGKTRQRFGKGRVVIMLTVDRLYGDVPTRCTPTHIQRVVRDYFRTNSDCWAVLNQVSVEIVGVHFVFENVVICCLPLVLR